LPVRPALPKIPLLNARFDKRTDGEGMRAHDQRTWWRMQIRWIALTITELGGVVRRVLCRETRGENLKRGSA
jgi:hypothetical protein